MQVKSEQRWFRTTVTVVSSSEERLVLLLVVGLHVCSHLLNISKQLKVPISDLNLISAVRICM